MALSDNEKRLRDAVAARLRRAQKAAKMSDKKRARQNKRVADEIKRQGK